MRNWGKVSFIFGILSLMLSWGPFTGVLLAVSGVIVGIKGLSKNANRKLVFFGLFLSLLGLILASFVTYATISAYLSLSSRLKGLTHDIIPDSCGSFRGEIVHSINDTQACLDSCHDNCRKKEMNLTQIFFNLSQPCYTCVCYCRE